MTVSSVCIVTAGGAANVTGALPTLTVGTLIYLAMVPFSLRRYGRKQRQWDAENPTPPQTAPGITITPALPVPPTETKH